MKWIRKNIQIQNKSLDLNYKKFNVTIQKSVITFRKCFLLRLSIATIWVEFNIKLDNKMHNRKNIIKFLL